MDSLLSSKASVWTSIHPSPSLFLHVAHHSKRAAVVVRVTMVEPRIIFPGPVENVRQDDRFSYFLLRRALLTPQSLLCHDSTWSPHRDTAWGGRQLRKVWFSFFDVLEKNLRFLPVRPRTLGSASLQCRSTLFLPFVFRVWPFLRNSDYDSIVDIPGGTTIFANGTTLSLRLMSFYGKLDSCGFFYISAGS